MRKPTAKKPLKRPSTAHKPLKPKKPIKAAKPAAAKKPKRPLKPKRPKAPTAHHRTRFGRRAVVDLPPVAATFVDLATDPAMPAVTDQGEGSCIAHATLAMFRWAAAKGLDVSRVTTLGASSIQARLTAGVPVVVGLMVCESFASPEALRSGVVTPTRREREIDGHYLLAVGIGWGHEWHDYPDADPAVRYVKLRNSWGQDAYRGGYLLLPLPYLERHVTELWTVG